MSETQYTEDNIRSLNDGVLHNGAVVAEFNVNAQTSLSKLYRVISVAAMETDQAKIKRMTESVLQDLDALSVLKRFHQIRLRVLDDDLARSPGVIGLDRPAALDCPPRSVLEHFPGPDERPVTGVRTSAVARKVPAVRRASRFVYAPYV